MTIWLIGDPTMSPLATLMFMPAVTTTLSLPLEIKE
jgi:hypothetical protein